MYTIEEENIDILKNLTADWWTKIYIHGWIQNYKVASIIVERYAAKDVNIIVVDWSKHSGCEYLHVVSYVIKNVAHILSKFICELYEIGFSPNKLHIIGHSFGAHIAGLASAPLGNRKVFRITGLDPSKIPFDMFPAKDRLNTLSAKFIDVIRTSIFGSTLNVGHVIFYPNGGFNQPGCKGLLRALCDHGKSVTYYAESIDTKTGFFAHKCLRNFAFRNNHPILKSNDETLIVGEYVPYNVSGRYCLETNSKYPYARGRS